MNHFSSSAEPVAVSLAAHEAIGEELFERVRQKRIERRKLLFGLFAADLIALVASFGLAFELRWPGTASLASGMPETVYFQVAAVLIAAFLFVFQLHGLYQSTNLFWGSGEYRRVFGATTAGVILVLLAGALIEPFRVGPGWIVLLWSLTLLFALLGRFLARRVVYLNRKRGLFVERTLVLGANSEGIAIVEQLRANPASGAHIVGFVDDSMKAGEEPLRGVPVLGGTSSFAALVKGHEIDSVLVADPAILRENLMRDERAMATLRGVEVQMAWGAFELLTTGLRIREEGFVPLVVLNKTRISGVHWLLKEILDRLCSLFAVVLLAPVFLLLAVLIKLDSRGPVFHRRRVVGVGRKEFDAFKIRTMRTEGDVLLTEDQRQEWDEQGKIKEDPRITRLGSFLRRYSIDELPQLINVLRGEMSIVGPRMVTMGELEKFGQWQHSLLTVKPGLTGLWQVSGRSDLSYEDRVRMDLHYIRNHTIWLDLQILLQTVPALLSGRGAY